MYKTSLDVSFNKSANAEIMYNYLPKVTIYSLKHNNTLKGKMYFYYILRLYLTLLESFNYLICRVITMYIFNTNNTAQSVIDT